MNWKTTLAFLVIAIAIGAFYLRDVEKVEQEKEIEKQKEEGETHEELNKRWSPQAYYHLRA